VTVKVEPLRRRQRAGCGGAQRVIRIIIRIHVRIQERIPERSSVRLVMKKSPG
jgi:hypothetical protein